MPKPPDVQNTILKSLADQPIRVRAGNSLATLKPEVVQPFAEDTLAYLGSVARILRNHPATRLYPEVAAFAYWCRPAHLKKLAQIHADRHLRLGRGLTLHIAPANVPVNFAYSFAFGLLAGNSNIVRVPDAFPEQTDVVCQAFSTAFDEPSFARISAANRLISYARDEAVTESLSSIAMARILWGGDKTIATLRAMPTQARSVDVCFADRYSLCLMAADAVTQASSADFAALITGFFNDAYLLDQNACSSPHLVIWQGATEKVAKAQARFWPALADEVRQRAPLQTVHAVDKLMALCRTALNLPSAVDSIRHGNYIYRIRLGNLPVDIEHHRGQHGFFFEYTTQDTGCLAEIVTPRYQTLTTFGIDRKELARQVIALGLPGIDRIVAVGQALDIGTLWDGHDLIAALSRIITTE